MTPACFVAALELVGWSKRQLAEMLACDHNLPARWAAGKAPVPPEIARWLAKLAAAHTANPTPLSWRTR